MKWIMEFNFSEINEVIFIVWCVGEWIFEIYELDDFDVEVKGDGLLLIKVD